MGGSVLSEDRRGTGGGGMRRDWGSALSWGVGVDASIISAGEGTPSHHSG